LDLDAISNGGKSGRRCGRSIVSDQEQEEGSEMNDLLNPNMMLEASRLTRAGRLTEATALLQHMLRGETAPDMSFGSAGNVALAGRTPPIIDAKSETIDGTDRPLFGAATSARPNRFGVLRGLFDRVRRRSGLRFRGLIPPASVSTPDIVPAGGKFIEASYSNPAGTRTYKLYIPSRYQGQALPLVVMLHGCTQSPDDFATGTRMNALAEEQTCLVAYPAQAAAANVSRCWNWFSPGDQQRNRGEPSLIAGITRQVMHDYSVDLRRVYVAGLSAGAAAAAIMGMAYPDLYAAIGVHSGLACGAAHDLPSAFAAMRQGDAGGVHRSFGASKSEEARRIIPTIVFHGDQDSTVHPRNGDHVIAQAAIACAGVQRRVEQGQIPGGHAYSRICFAAVSGEAILEHWIIHGAGHAWSGGSPAGSYTDPRGPDAAREMLRFFLEQPAGPAAP